MGLGAAVAVMRKIAVILLASALLSPAAFAEDNEKMFTSAGAADVAVVGEPVHVGDEITASILVHNQGSETGSVRLVLTDSEGTNLSIGDDVAIPPGSSREVSASLTPSSAGVLNMSWEVGSDDGGVSSLLQGSLEIHVYEAQSLDLSFDEVDWTLADGLDSQISVALSEGESRDVNISIALGYQGVEHVVQGFSVTLEPGLRTLSLDLGEPEADYLSVTLEPRGWTTSNSASNLTWQVDLDAPSISPSVELGPHLPNKPSPGDSVSLPYWLNNSGDAVTLSGELRVVRTSDGMLLAERIVSSVSSGGTSSGTMEISPWPDSQIVELEVTWFMEGAAVSEFLSVESTDSGGGTELPFDLMAAFYGALSGFAVVLVGIIAWRTVSERTPGTEEGRGKMLRDSRITRRFEKAPAKREIQCPNCEQRLNIPSEHTGTVRCPACMSQFSAEPAQEEPAVQFPTEPRPQGPGSSEGGTAEPEPAPSWPVARSNEEILSCPECDQRLRVPLERRPVRSRCPACRTEFMAEVG